jgi:hypothetical protein
MRTPTLHPVETQLRRRTVLGFLSFVLMAGLTGCDGAGPAEPDLGPSVNHPRVPLRRMPGRRFAYPPFSDQREAVEAMTGSAFSFLSSLPSPTA